jgi:hypothetical protein
MGLNQKRAEPGHSSAQPILSRLNLTSCPLAIGYWRLEKAEEISPQRHRGHEGKKPGLAWRTSRSDAASSIVGMTYRSNACRHSLISLCLNFVPSVSLW